VRIVSLLSPYLFLQGTLAAVYYSMMTGV